MTELFINGVWRAGRNGAAIPVENPATGETIGSVAKAEPDDVDAAIGAATVAFQRWREKSAYHRYGIMREAANLLRERQAEIARQITVEQGKPIAEALSEVAVTADVIDWNAEEGRRAYGRIIPGRTEDTRQLVLKEPVGVVAAFSPWNFPIQTAAMKVAAAIAAGCAVVLKAAEETPGAPAAMVQAFADAGLPAGVLNLVFGEPAQISERIIADQRVRKLSFTGSTIVGRHLAALAGRHLKRLTMELGGHAPAIVFADANWEAAAEILSSKKYRNAGQVCGSPTRILVQKQIFERFADRFTQHSAGIRVGDGMHPDTLMGPLANSRRIASMEDLIEDATNQGAELRLGGKRIGNRGFFFEPSIVSVR
ncbi:MULTISPECIES: aldehyde dehydrogenase family protein [Hyphomicrobiales]|jgi:succinate-semialdehyde dehydrogenase/glutarate-semialdehyde dehydrogenase|uniref:aldehyde dehydrogenase family protein n=1 Tax=Hyphomicrobiales TaxID=356 RepID=UPI0010F71A94|nr:MULTISPECIES: aldehyde dehydrogenase family protein [Mesorhizobium]MBA3038669.1 aldehyde dehydrogenase family protein [Rhizobiaceae bacterium]MBN8949180.1 aldehyde dehydrogenase family protein [Rhizobium tropici]MBN8993631.1 aldehyde dehydrogenase family protein [Hyphomicrobiales bacterium]MBN9134533.1 aldehyde dehydrogenase family protein [Phyllobacterium sp.]MBN9217126.1 aldehyde dehydrogenase family protein [Mesorhizobium sp.]